MRHSSSKPTIQICVALTVALLLAQCSDTTTSSDSTNDESIRTTAPPTTIPTEPSTTAPAEAPTSLPPVVRTEVPTEAKAELAMPPSAAVGPTTLTQRGIGELEVGPSLSHTDIEAYFDIGFSPKNQGNSCRLSMAEDVGLAAVGDDYTAIWGFIVENPDIRTAENIGVGSSYEEVVAAYGELVDVLDFPSQTGGPIIAVDDMTQPGDDFTMESRLMAFDTDANGTVTRVRVGMYPWVIYTDYCSHDTASITHERTGWPLTRLLSPSGQ